ncbi:MAG TPA: hypothetical protein VMD09_06910 [Solirubrobacteraceae bacterium]|nr:hypothetical protein [Solirubrobacteraceae bacterium]
MAAADGGILALAIVAFEMVALALLFLYAARHRDEPGNGGDDGGGPGGGGGGPDRPSPPPRGSDPVWWPEFEHQFARYVARARQSHRPVERIGP